jgi:phosphatidylserine/phosphatidylglycerophosphate/cardiolipin synthase-like enzyme
MQELHEKLQSISHPIRVRAVDVQFLENPHRFLECIIHRISLSTRQLVFSSLYIGSDPLSRKIVCHLHRLSGFVIF